MTGRAVGFELALILGLILLNGLFAMAEMALIAARRPRLQRRAAQGDRGAQAALELAGDPNRFLSTVQVGITLVGTLAAVFGGATVAEALAAWIAAVAPALAGWAPTLAVTAVVAGIGFATLVLGELVPKRLALAHADAIAVRLARPLRGFAFLVVPLVRGLAVATDLVLWLLRVQPPEHATKVTVDDIQLLLKEGVTAGAVTPTEQAMVRRLLRLGEQPIATLMTRRSEVTWIDLRDPAAVLAGKLAASHIARFPVCDGSLDAIVGVVEVRDLLLRVLGGGPPDVRGILKMPLFLYEGTPALRALELLRGAAVHLAVVLDEYGSVEGLVATSDIMAAVLGDLAGGDGIETPGLHPRDDGSWLADGTLPLDEFVDRLDLPERPRGDSHTLAGFVLEQLGRIPRPADAFEWSGLRIEVVDMDGNRIDKLLIAPLPRHSSSPPSAPGASGGPGNGISHGNGR